MKPEFVNMFCSKMILLGNFLFLVSLFAFNFLKHFGTMLDMHREMVMIKHIAIPHFSSSSLVSYRMR
jgi:hypothetical protein